MGNESNDEQPIAAPGDAQQHNTGEHQLDLPPGVGTGVLALAALRARLGLESLNEGLGSMIGNLSYDEYRQFAGVLMQLRIEEDAESRHGRARNILSHLQESMEA